MASVGDRGDVLSETLAVFDPATPGEPLTTSEVAAELDCSRRATYDRLERLAERGDLDTKKVGARGRVWWRPPGEEAAPDADRPGQHSRILANVPGMVYRCRADPERAMSFVGEGCREVAGYGPASLESGDRRWDADVVHPADRQRVREAVRAGPAEGGRYAVEYRIRTADGETRWVRDRGRAVDGSEPVVEGVITDVSDARGADGEGAAVGATGGYANVMLGPDGRVESWNAGAERLTGYGTDEVVGEHVSAFYTESDREAGVPEQNLATAEREGSVEEAATWVRGDGSTFPAAVTVSAIRDDDGVLLGYSTVVRDLAERREYERRIRRERDDLRAELTEVFERIDDGFEAFDEDLRYTFVNERAEEMLRHDEEELLGVNVWEAFPDAAEMDAYHTALGTQGPTSFEHYVDRLDAWIEGDVCPSETGLSVYTRDITERKERELGLAALHDTSRQLLAAETKSEVSEIVVEAATDVLDLDVIVYRYDDDRLRPEVQSADADFIRRAFPEATVDDGSLLGHVFADGECRRFDDVRESPHHRDDGEMRAGLFAPMADHGLVVAGSREAGSFGDHTRQLVEVLAANAEATYDRVERERELQRQRERLAALNELNAVVREITEALIEQSTREEVERAVCERLADSGSYEFALVGEVGRRGDEVTVRTAAGVDDALDLDLSVAPEHPASDGPTARALRTREVQVVADAGDQQCHAHVDEPDLRSMAAIPIAYGDVLYGVLNVYASRPGAFTGQERAVVAQLGNVVGHAINAVDRKRALMTDDVTEVQFRLRDVFEEFGIEGETDGTITFDRTIPVGGGVFLTYGTATDDADEVLVTFDERVPAIEDVTVLHRQRGKTKFELRVVEPPVISLIASQGGDVRGATIDDGDYYVTFHLPPGLDVREVIELAEEAYPPIEMVTRRQVTRTERPGRGTEWPYLERLTDRQRAALLAGYYSGFFDWPRVSSGEEVADSLDVSPSTFHQHVRLAEKKLLEAVLADYRT